MEHIHKSKENEMARKPERKHEVYENQASSEDSRLNALLQIWVKKKKKRKKERERERKKKKKKSKIRTVKDFKKKINIF